MKKDPHAKLRFLAQEPALRMLMSCSRERSRITYKQMSEFVELELNWPRTKTWRHMGDVAGDLMDRIWDVDPNAPPINLLVYNGDSGLPSEGADGHLERYMHRVGFLEKLGDKERRKTIGRFTHHIWEYPIAEWQRIYTTIFGQPCTALPTCPSGHQFPDWDINTIGRYRGTGESQEHKALKERVMLERDRVIGKKALYFVEPEVGLSSGDIVDVFFSLPDEVVCVEVKSSISSDDDIRRGIFQCIKYQAVAQAEELSEPAYAKPRTVRALLIIGRKSLRTKRLRDLAAKLNVTVQCWG